MSKIRVQDDNYENKYDETDPDPLNQGGNIDHEAQRYPYCIVWTPLPCISCCCPCIGHVGIAG